MSRIPVNFLCCNVLQTLTIRCTPDPGPPGNSLKLKPEILDRLFLLLWLIPQTVCAQFTDPGPYDPSAQASAAMQIFQVVPEQSILRVMVGRSGLLQRMGHNHVIVNRSLSGTLRMDTRTKRTYARLYIPVREFLVDDPAERLRAGPGYESVPDTRAKADTQANMLQPEILDIGTYPEIIIDANDAPLVPGQSTVALVVSFKGRQIPLQLPITMATNGGNLVVDSIFRLDHQQLGLRPFSVLGGALRVSENINFELHLEAIPP